MKKRSPIGVLLLTFVTFGIYGVVWTVKTKKEMVSLGAAIPTCWLLLVPIVNIWWHWRFCKGVQYVTNGGREAVGCFLLIIFLGVIGMAYVQAGLNRVAAAPTMAAPVLV